MKVFITGGTGLIGRLLVETLSARGDKIVVLTRDQEKAQKLLGNNVETCSSLKSINSFDDVDVVVNLAGESIAGKRWSKQQKEKLQNSRWQITRRLSELINGSKTPPQVFISGSAVGYYGSQGDTALTESDPPHKEFTNQLCEQWEAYAMEAKTRVCILRTGIVLSSDGGMLAQMALPFKLGLGATIGSGRQYISWVHIWDMVNAILFLIDNSSAQGAYNVTSPNPVTNKAFSKSLAKSVHRPCLFWIPSFLVKLVLGETSTLLVDGQRVIPQKLTDAGYKFTFEDIDAALSSIL